MASEVQDGISKWCNKEFLENALQQGKSNSDLRVVSYEIEKATASGDNYLSDMYRIKLKTNEKDKESTSLIIKCSPLKEGVGKLVSDLNLFERETKALNVVLPEFYKILEQASPGTYQPLAAACLHHQNTANRSVIVLEDLKAQGFKMAQRLLGLSLDHCVLVMKMLARLHGASIGLYKKDPGFIESFNFKDIIEESTGEGMFATSVKSLAIEVDTWVHDEQFADFPERLRKCATECEDKLEEIKQMKEDELNVLTHGDCWVNNMMFRYDDSNIPQDHRFVDFQLSYWSSPVLDLLYFLYTSPQPHLWDKHNLFLEEYHKELRNTLQVLGHEELLPTFEELCDLIERKLFYGFFASVVLIPFVLRDPNNIIGVAEIVKESEKLSLSSKSMHSNPQMRAVYKRILPIFARKGIF